MFRYLHSSRLCVAILTGYSPNVFYELAIAQAANRPVIILIKEGSALPFDVKDLRCIGYDLEVSSKERQQYVERLKAFIADLEAHDWKVPDFLASYRLEPSQHSESGRRNPPALGNAFWLGHDLARAVRMAMFELERSDELEKELRQVLHHLDEVGIVAPDARRLLLRALQSILENAGMLADEQKELVSSIAQAKNEIGNRIAELQQGFKAYASIERANDLNRELQSQV